ncbi:uncharacterized protein [Dendrobates tinctorius]|uniref:uncharacterized protein n=1 Tax=Dendrobates tinctorius TaxID=92724 RepID=UPI003CC9E324
MRATHFDAVTLTIFLSVLCCGFAFDKCTGVNKENVVQAPYLLEVNSGEDAIFNCTVTGWQTLGVNVRKRFKKILFINKTCNDKKPIDLNYKGRLSCSGNLSRFSVILKNLTVTDTDIYYCDTVTVKFTEICGSGTLLIVRPPDAKVLFENKDTATKEKEQDCQKNAFDPVPYIITILFMLALCVAFSIYMKVKTTKEKQNANHNTYVDMTQTLRRNTMGNSFSYKQSPNSAILS